MSLRRFCSPSRCPGAAQHLRPSGSQPPTKSSPGSMPGSYRSSLARGATKFGLKPCARCSSTRSFKHLPKTLSDAQIRELINASLRDVAALETALDHIESDLVAFHVRYREHPESREIEMQVDATRKLIRALLNGETLPSMTVAEPPV